MKNGVENEYGEIAQLARARGSYPRCRGFESPSRYFADSLLYAQTFQQKFLIEYGEIAQLARARGSYPRCRGFESPSRYYRCCRLQHLFFLSISEADLECPLRYLLMNAVASRSVSGSFQVKRHKTWHVFFPVNNF